MVYFVSIPKPIANVLKERASTECDTADRRGQCGHDLCLPSHSQMASHQTGEH